VDASRSSSAATPSWIRRADEARVTALALGACAVLSLVLLGPCVPTGLVADDLLHQLMLRPDPGLGALARQPWDLFRFASGDPAVARALIEAGVFPWWADPAAKLAFFRPLASLTHAVDHALWAARPALMHLHSLAWFGLLLGAVAAFYVRFSPRRAVALLAFALFAVDDAHAPVAGWIANRNALVALCLALPAVSFHDRYRRERSRAGAWLGPLSLAVGLCGGETALVACAYLTAYALFLDRGPAVMRYGSLVPYGFVVLGWRLTTAALGYGVAGSGLYVDPLTSPLAFVSAVAERLPVLALAQIALPWADFWEVYPLTAPALRGVVFALAVVVTAAFAVLVRPLWRAHAHVRFWAAGSVLSLVPVCATFPHDRVLLGAGVGAMALVAELLVAALGSLRRRDQVVVAALGSVHLGLAPLMLPFRAAHVGDLTRVLERADESIPSGDDVRRKGVILLNPPLDPLAAYLPLYRDAARRPRPETLLWLATGVTDLTVRTLDANTVRVRAHDGFLSTSSQWMLRAPHRKTSGPEVVSLDAARVEVVSLTEDERPLEIDVCFREPIESEALLWLRWHDHGYVPFTLPAPGSSVVVPAVDVGRALFGH
jgi:hypothetical protein